MNQMRVAHRRRSGQMVLAAAGILVLLAAPPALARRPVTASRGLVATGADPNGSGRAKLVLHSDSNGKFDLLVHRLDPSALFDVLVGGVRVGSLTTNRGGNGKARFRSRPRPHDGLLGFDPRGQEVVVRNADGQDVLSGTLPDGSAAGEGACCLPGHDGEVECDDRTPDACTQAGGTVATTASCLPNPCDTTPPTGVVCCLADSASGALLRDEQGDDGDDEDHGEVECETELTQAECATRGGAVVQANSCHPNPCMGTPPPAGAVSCCVPDDDHAECEVLTPERCALRSGTPASTPSCEPDPCGGAEHHRGKHGD